MKLLTDIKETIIAALNGAREAYLDLAKKDEVGVEKCVNAFGDISTIGDLTCEEVIVKIISSKLRDVSFITEERGIIGDIKNSEHIVLIDPIDGSTNMKRGIRFFSAGVAVFKGVNYNDIAAAGVIDIPSGQVFFADRTELYVDKEKPSPRNVIKLEKAVISLDFRPLKREGEIVEIFRNLCRKIRHVRNLGSSLLEICQIVTGKIDAFVCLTPELRLFDLIPALFILQRAGGCWIMDKSKINLTEQMVNEKYAVIAASNNHLLEEIVNTVSIDWINNQYR